MAAPSIITEFSPTTDPYATPVWVDMSPYVRSITTDGGRQHELDRMQARTCTIVLRNGDRRFDPTYKAGPYYGNLLPLRRIRVRALLDGVYYPIFSGFIERYPMTYFKGGRPGSKYAETTITASDGFTLLGQAQLLSTAATLTTAQGSNRDLTYTATPGFEGNSVQVAYLVSGTNTALSVAVSTLTINVTVATDGSGNATSTASDVLAAVQASTTASALVTVALASGSTGAGVVAAMAATNLAGGTFAQQLSSARVAAVLDNVGWPSADRVIDTGESTVPAKDFDSSTTTDALSHLLDVGDAEGGLLFVGSDGNVHFIDRNSLLTQFTTSKGTFSDNPTAGQFGYTGIVPSYDLDLIFNDWKAQGPSGATLEAADDPSIAHFGRRSKTMTPLLTTDADVLSLLQFELPRYKDAQLRFDSIDMAAGSNTAFWQTILAVDFGDRVTVIDSAVGVGDPVELDCYIQRSAWKIDCGPATNAQLTWSLFAVGGAGNYLVLDDPVLGKLDQNVLSW